MNDLIKRLQLSSRQVSAGDLTVNDRKAILIALDEAIDALSAPLPEDIRWHIDNLRAGPLIQSLADDAASLIEQLARQAKHWEDAWKGCCECEKELEQRIEELEQRIKQLKDERLAFAIESEEKQQRIKELQAKYKDEYNRNEDNRNGW